VSLRAHSLGGVALAAGDPARGQALLGWAAIDTKQPQLFATLVDTTGKKIAQRMLTKRSGELGDVAATFVGDGYMIAWVDERSGDAEVYAMKVNGALQTIAPERRLTNARGAATAVTLLRRKDDVLLSWADARDLDHPGWADPYTMRLRPSDASPLGGEVRVAETSLHSHSPVLTAFGTATAVAWVEADPGGTANDRSGVMLAELDAAGRPTAEPTLVRVGDGVPTGVALECASARCRGVIGVETSGRGELRGFSWSKGSVPKLVRLAGLSAPGAENVMPTLVDGELIYADQVDRHGIVRRMSIDWE
jgi:hypothetical protein